jgi:negative regulator of sigma E activity
MITCKNVRETLMDALAEEQTAPEVLAHLRECAGCSAELDGLRKTMALLDEWEAPEPSPYFLTRVKAHAREEQKTPVHAGPLAWFRKPVLAATFAAVLAAGGVVLRLSVFENEAPATPQVGTAVADIEQLDKNADVLVNTDLIDELSGAPSDDVAEP